MPNVLYAIVFCLICNLFEYFYCSDYVFLSFLTVTFFIILLVYGDKVAICLKGFYNNSLLYFNSKAKYRELRMSKREDFSLGFGLFAGYDSRRSKNTTRSSDITFSLKTTPRSNGFGDSFLSRASSLLTNSPVRPSVGSPLSQPTRVNTRISDEQTMLPSPFSPFRNSRSHQSFSTTSPRDFSLERRGRTRLFEDSPSWRGGVLERSTANEMGVDEFPWVSPAGGLIPLVGPRSPQDFASPCRTESPSQTPRSSRVRVRLAPPNRSDNSLNGSLLDMSSNLDESATTRSVIQVLKEMSRKRPYRTDNEGGEEDGQECKRQRAPEHMFVSSFTSDNQNPQKACIEEERKRGRGEMEWESSPPAGGGLAKRRRFNSNSINNEILSSLSSSICLLQPHNRGKAQKKVSIGTQVTLLKDSSEVKKTEQEAQTNVDKVRREVKEVATMPDPPPPPRRPRSPVKEKEVTNASKNVIFKSALSKFNIQPKEETKNPAVGVVQQNEEAEKPQNNFMTASSKEVSSTTPSTVGPSLLPTSNFLQTTASTSAATPTFSFGSPQMKEVAKDKGDVQKAPDSKADGTTGKQESTGFQFGGVSAQPTSTTSLSSPIVSFSSPSKLPAGGSSLNTAVVNPTVVSTQAVLSPPSSNAPPKFTFGTSKAQGGQNSSAESTNSLVPTNNLLQSGGSGFTFGQQNISSKESSSTTALTSTSASPVFSFGSGPKKDGKSEEFSFKPPSVPNEPKPAFTFGASKANNTTSSTMPTSSAPIFPSTLFSTSTSPSSSTPTTAPSSNASSIAPSIFGSLQPALQTSAAAATNTLTSAVTTPSLFSSSTPSQSMFSAQPVTSSGFSSGFGQSTATPASTVTFGSTTTAPSLFSNSNPSGAIKSTMFGDIKSSTSSAPPSFGSTNTFTPSSTAGFGTATTSATTMSPLFGSITTSTASTAHSFGNKNNSTSTTSTLFGSISTSMSSTTSTFSANPTTSAAPLFGNKNVTTTPAFGGNDTKTTAAPMFGSNTTTTSQSIFGSTSAPSTATGNLFGNTISTSTTPGNLFGNNTTASATPFSNPTTTAGPSSLFGSGSNTSEKPAFGSTPNSVANNTFSALGSSSGTTFGSTGGANTVTFGSNLGTTPAFGSAPTTTNSLSFGNPSTTTTTNSFGSGISSTPAFGGSTVTTAAPPSFGSSALPSFGSQPSTTPSFSSGTPNLFAAGSTGASSGPSFGNTSTTAPTFGTTPVIGTSTSAFGSTGSAPAFGSTSFGNSQAPAPAFGSQTQGFGTTSSTPAFGSTAPAFGASNTFGSQPATPSFGSTGFGSAASGPGASSGFGSAPSGPGTSSGFGSAPSGSGFGSGPTSTTAPAFGSGTLPGAAPSFGSPAPTFGSSTPSFGSSTFGAQGANKPFSFTAPQPSQPGTFNFTATQQPQSSGGLFQFGTSNAANQPFQFNANTPSVAPVGGGQQMFSIGSGSTAPRRVTAARRKK